MQKQFYLKNPKSKQIDFEKDTNSRLRSLASKSNLLLHLMHEMAKAKSKERLFSLTTEYVVKIFDVVNAAVYFPDEKNRNLISFSNKSNGEFESKLDNLNLIKQVPLNSDYPLIRSFKNKRTVTSTSDVPSSIKKTGIKSSYFFPIIYKEETQGVLALRANKIFPLGEEDIKIGELLAIHLGLKIHNQELADYLRQQKDTLELMQNSVKEGLALHGADGVIYYANKAIGQFFGNTAPTIGLKREELIKNWDKYHKYKVSHLYDVGLMRKTVYEERKPFANGLIVVHSSPEKLIEANYYPVVKEGEFAGMAAAYRDVSKEKKQEAQLELTLKKIQKERDRWQAIFSNVDEGVCVIDKTLNIIHMNPACQVFSGLDLDKALGRNYYAVFKCHTQNGLYFPDFNPLEKVLLTEEPIPYEEYLQTNASGEELWVGVSASPIKDVQGEVQEIVLVIRDINTLKEIEKSKSQFVSIASHELRTPLTVINGYLSLLINGDLGDFTDPDSAEKIKAILGKVYGETNRLTDLVSDLLNVSRIEEKRIQLNRKNSPLFEVIKQVVEELRMVANQKDINLTITETKNLNQIHAYFDRNKIHEVVLNLVDNAIKFTPNGGEVFINCWQEKEKVFVSVKDSGIGIPARLQSVIFEKFQQVPGSYLKENRGTGLGLFIVKSLVELHEGDLNVQSEPGKGSTFTFSLPVGVA